MDKMPCGHMESVYKNWADDAPHYCIVCGLGVLKLQNSELRKALIEIQKYVGDGKAWDDDTALINGWLDDVLAVSQKPKCECPHHSFKPDMQGCRCCGQSVGQGVEKRKCDCLCHVDVGSPQMTLHQCCTAPNVVLR